jgi:hypothetical protein
MTAPLDAVARGRGRQAGADRSAEGHDGRLRLLQLTDIATAINPSGPRTPLLGDRRYGGLPAHCGHDAALARAGPGSAV